MFGPTFSMSLTHAMEMNLRWDNASRTLRAGLLGTIHEIPKNYSSETMLFLGSQERGKIHCGEERDLGVRLDINRQENKMNRRCHQSHERPSSFSSTARIHSMSTQSTSVRTSVMLSILHGRQLA